MLVKRYRNRVVQKMRRVRDGIELIFLSAMHGAPRERLVISQADWQRYGSEKYEEGKSAEDFRAASVRRSA